MLIQTAQAAAHIQYADPICTPFFTERCRVEPIQPPYIVWLSDYRPESQIQLPTFVSPRWSASPSPFALGELLNWDFEPDAAPDRPSGEIVVKLEYIGRGAPAQFHGTWD